MFRPTEVALLRTPLAAIGHSAFSHPISERLALQRALQDPLLMEAVGLASPDLAAGIERLARFDNQRPISGVLVGLAGYAARMCGRATPFGLFAGVTTVSVGASAARLGTAHTHRTGPDRAWLAALLADLHKDPTVLAALWVVAHPSIKVRGTRVLVDGCEHAAGDPRRNGELGEVSLRRTALVEMVLATAASPIRVEDLWSSAAPYERGQVLRVVAALVRTRFLRTELDQAAEGPQPMASLEAVLRRIPGTGHADQVAAVRAAMTEYDTQPPGSGLEALNQLRERMRQVADSAYQVCVDTRLDAVVTVPQRVLDEAATTAAALWRLTPDQPPRHLTEYRDRFVARYGLDRAVSLLDLLDDHIGLGLPDCYLHSASPSPEVAPDWASRLLKLWADATAAGAEEIVLDDAAIRELTPGFTDGEQPGSCDMFVRVAARDLASLARGDFQLARPGFSNAPAAATAARFVDLFPDRGAGFAHQVVAADQPPLAGAVYAELHFQPLHARSGNVAHPPGWLTRRVYVDLPPRAAHDLTVRDLAVSCDGQRLHLHTEDGQMVVPVSHSVLHPRFAPPVARFLLEVGSWHCRRPQGWNWGPLAQHAPFLPRVRYRRSILSCASWLIPHHVTAAASSADRWRQEIDRWRAHASVPSAVVAGSGDMRVPLDLTNAVDVALLRREQRTRDVIRVFEQDAVTDGWLRGSDGVHLAELVIPLLPTPRTRHTQQAVIARPVRHFPDRVFPPGGDRWLYAVLAVPARSQNTVLQSITDGIPARAGSWFFVRYRDDTGRPCLRLRFRVADRDDRTALLDHLAAATTELRRQRLCDLLRLDTYDPELERYGGPHALNAAEHLFCADTAAVIKTLAVDADPVTAAGLAAVELIDALTAGHQPTAPILGTVRGHPSPQRAVVRRLTQAGIILPALQGLEAEWSGRREAARAYGLAIAHLSKDCRPHAVRSVLHMHCNRLLGSTPQAEAEALLLARDAIAYRHAHQSVDAAAT
jgi:thiopeptide-type bacteriocin biosynthesis protein